ncbi:alcohol dehydrogenase catalytic domain-containing protein [Mycobacterium kansasii]|uniref:Zinc-binding dehydrogenase family protein n=2 Tax=Mycobacterium kansasii TaxID=1768 RepID=A0A1V3WWK1_MYCKA|nr:alcohol dehydrogenase catalytic domain-containing protein [Mycobacterium kansasii]EUA04448.1 zinc-binding dehydrogenase family protein [Mycobacterium kansasii 824]ARG59487.1 alcohol dehydrogenase [Mycobacterium kansasii]ARG64957.1 alcohol dehydrogenase [Mycobacterium kansasii]ARG78282.1 alcohol dehydrogenase [Mycobacterium kansasii]ARG83735.1 alcohol dehydrogenase [Mycobacterium kansasii]
MFHIRGAVLERIGSPRPYVESRPIGVADLDLEAPGSDEVLVRIEAAGVCHSDLSVVNGNRVRPVPMLLGHEAAGIVEQAGDRVDDVAVGQRVVLVFLPRCEHCAACATEGMTPCQPAGAANAAGTLLGGAIRLSRQGHPVYHHLGVSGFATHAVVNRASAIPVPDDVPPHVAALLGCAVLTGGGAVLNVGNPRPGQSVAVVGLGGVGMAAVLTALTYPDVRVIGVDQMPEKLSAAKKLGVHDAYTPQRATDAGVKADVVVEAVGHPGALETAIALTAPGGRTVTVGLPPPDARISISPLGFVAEGRSLIGSYLGSAVPSRDIPRFVSLWRSGRLPVESLVSSTIRLDDINAAMDRLADGTAIRQLITF